MERKWTSLLVSLDYIFYKLGRWKQFPDIIIEDGCGHYSTKLINNCKKEHFFRHCVIEFDPNYLPSKLYPESPIEEYHLDVSFCKSLDYNTLNQRFVERERVKDFYQKVLNLSHNYLFCLLIVDGYSATRRICIEEGVKSDAKIIIVHDTEEKSDWCYKTYGLHYEGYVKLVLVDETCVETSIFIKSDFLTEEQLDDLENWIYQKTRSE